jgi:hypothetical protein
MTNSVLDTAMTKTAIWRCVAESESSWIYCSLTMVAIKERQDGVLEARAPESDGLRDQITITFITKLLFIKKEGK